MQTIIHQADGSTQTYNGGYTPVSSTPASSSSTGTGSPVSVGSASSSNYSYHPSSSSSSNTSSNPYAYNPNMNYGNTGLRNYFQGAGYDVNYNSDNGNIDISKNGKTYGSFNPNQYTNTDGTANINQGLANYYLSQWNGQQNQNISQPTSTTPTTTTPAATTPQVISPPTIPDNSKAYAMVQNGVQQFMNPSQFIDRSGMQNYAQQFAQSQAQQQETSLQNLLNQYQQQYNTSVGTIDNSTAQAKQALEDKYFQNYLAARDDMANRGLAGSGLANDQNTRMLLAKQQDLAGIYQDAATRQADAQGQFNNQADNVYQQMQQINPGLMADTKYQDLYQQAMQNQLQANSTAANFLGNTFGYMFPSQNAAIQAQANMYDSQTKAQASMYNSQLKAATDMFKWTNASADEQIKAQTQAQQLGFDMYKFSNLSADQKATIAEKLYQFNNLSAKDQADLVNKAQQLGIMQQNANTSAYNAQTNRLNQQETVQRDLSTANYQIGQLQNGQLRDQASGLQTQLNAASTQLDNARSAYFANAGNPDAKAAYDAAQQNYDRARSGLDTLLKLGGQTGLTTTYGNNAPNPTTDEFGNELGFNNGQGGGEYYKSQQDASSNPQAYQAATDAIQTALNKTGAPISWLQPMLEIAARESDFDPNNQNNSSTAYGMFQFLNGTWDGTGYSKTSDPEQQSEAAIQYIKNRYGTASNALQTWDKQGWY